MSSSVAGVDWFPQELVGFDLETTSPDPRTARVVSFAVVRVARDGAREVLAADIVDPGVPIPEMASQVHGISTARAQREGMGHGAAVERIRDVLESVWARGGAVVAHNAPFDLTVVDQHLREGLTVSGLVVDTLALSRAFDRDGGHTLGEVAQSYGVQLGSAHEALSDAVGAAAVAWTFAEVLSRCVRDGVLPSWCLSSAASFMQAQHVLAVGQQIDKGRVGEYVGWPRLGDVVDDGGVPPVGLMGRTSWPPTV